MTPLGPSPSASMAQGHAIFASVLAIPCRRHDAPPGEPCWVYPKALCAHRMRARGVSR